MAERFKPADSSDRVQSEEVRRGEIIACIGQEEHFVDENGVQQNILEDYDLEWDVEEVEYINPDPEWNSTTKRRLREKLDARGHKNAGIDTYVISNVNDRDKLSAGYSGCIGIVLVGYSSRMGKNISILTHNSPPTFGFGSIRPPAGEVWPTEQKFRADFAERAQELMSQIDPDSVSAMVYAGRTDQDEYIDFKKNIDAAKDLVRSVIGKEPREVVFPNEGLNEETDVYFQTQTRRLFVAKRKVEYRE